jgi:hypothetical protein
LPANTAGVKRLWPRRHLTVEKPDVATAAKAMQESIVVRELAFDHRPEVDRPALRVAIPERFYGDS